MEQQTLVYIDLNGEPSHVGRLWTRARNQRESATFEYDREWLAHPQRFALESALSLGPGPFHTMADRPLFGAMGDSAPDRWGRTLMRRAERRRSDTAGTVPRTLREIDYLLHVDDEARQGALRFAAEPGGPFLAEHDRTRIPPLVELPRLLAAADRVGRDADTHEDLRLLLAPGSSLGGARPKASVRGKDGRLLIAKLPSSADEINVVGWEAVALRLAKKAGIEVAGWRVETVASKPVLLLERFDRAAQRRIPFLSAMSMLGARDNEERSYLEMADALRRHGANTKADLQALWRRIVFHVAISNTDDHLRNHGFLYPNPKGWRLSPAYDLNPTPLDVKPRVLSISIGLDPGEASLDAALSVAGYFELSLDAARATVRQVLRAARGWRKTASSLGLAKSEQDRMASAFEIADAPR